MRSRPIFVFVLFLVSVAFHPPRPLFGSQDSQWFDSHASRDKRYFEGILDQPNAKQAYEVIGFFASAGRQRKPLDPHPAPQSTLRAWFYVPSVDEQHPLPASVSIRAKQIASRTNYLMQSAPHAINPKPDSWNPFPWETDAVISRYNINPNNLGVIVNLDSENPQTTQITPAFVCLPCKQNERITSYELMLKIQRYSLADLSYQVDAPSSTGSSRLKKTCYFTVQNACLPSPPKQTSAIEVGTIITLPFDASPVAGDVTISIAGQYRNTSERLELTYTFFGQPEFHTAP